MPTDQWDQCFIKLAEQVLRLERSVAGSNLQDQLIQVQKQSAILEYASAAHSLLERMDFFFTRDLNTDKKSKAIIFWANRIGEMIKRIYQKKMVLVGRSVWLNLVKLRLSLGGASSSSFLEDINIVEMATREVELKNLEGSLKQKLVDINHVKQHLIKEYHRFQAGQSNLEAGQCLQRRWSPKNDIEYSILNSFINNISTVSRSSTPEEIALQKQHRDLIAETNKVVEKCKVMLTKDIGPHKMTIGTTRIQDLESSLASLNVLRKQILGSQREIKKHPLRPLHPTMVNYSPLKGETLQASR